MAGTPEPEPSVEHGWRATVFALLFAGAVLGGAGIATAISAPDGHDDKVEVDGADHSDDDNSDEDHGDS